MVTYSYMYLSYSQHPRFKNVPSEMSHDAIAIHFLIFLLSLSFCPESSVLDQDKIGLIYTFLSVTTYILGAFHLVRAQFYMVSGLPIPLFA